MPTLEQTILDYAAYHRDFRNKLTHHVGVPMIIYAIFLSLAWFRFIGWDGLLASYASVVYLMMTFYYVKMDRVVGLAVAIYMFPLVWLANWIVMGSFVRSVEHFFFFFVVGWIIQLAGHWLEGRKPALVDHILQVFNSPIFMVCELMFLFGARKKLKAKVEATYPA